MTHLFDLIDRIGLKPLLGALAVLFGVMFLMIWSQDRQNAADRAAAAAELTRKCLAANYSKGQCEFIVALAMRPILSTGPDPATMAAIEAAAR